MRKPAPLRLDSTYNGEEVDEKNGMAPRADKSSKPDEDDGGR